MAIAEISLSKNAWILIEFALLCNTNKETQTSLFSFQ